MADSRLRQLVGKASFSSSSDKYSALVELDKIEQDARRIDALERNRRVAEIVIDGKKTDCWHYGVAGAPGVPLRDIIDKAHGIEAPNAAPSGASDGVCRSCVNDKCVTGPECVTLSRDDDRQVFAFLAVTETGERAHFGVEATAKAWAGAKGSVRKVTPLVLASDRDEWVDAQYAALAHPSEAPKETKEPK